jgi:hypothetical protein
MVLRRRAPATKVEDLPVFGEAFDHLPLTGQLLQARLLFSRLASRYGWGIVGVLRATVGKRAELKRSFGPTIQREFPTLSSSGVNELLMLAALYHVMVDRDGREVAYEFILDLFRSMGPSLHVTLYDAKHLLRCAGDPYENFCALNRSFFESSASKGFYDLDELTETENLQFIRLSRCANVDVFTVLGCPELARVACEADITGYGPDGLATKVDLDFRRPKTIVHGDATCDFYYYRAGAAPLEMETH